MAIREEDLIVDCPTCGGTGTIGSKSTSGRSQTWESNCSVCNGSKVQLTESGKVLKDFINLVLHNRSLTL